MQRAAGGKYKKNKKKEDKIGALRTLRGRRKSPTDQFSCVLLQIAKCGLGNV